MDIDPKRDTSKSPFTKRQTSRLSVPEILGYLLAVVWVLFSLFLILSDRLNSDSALLNHLPKFDNHAHLACHAGRDKASANGN